VPDAVLAAAKFAEIFCIEGPFSKLKAKYPQNFMAREKFAAKDKAAAMERITNGVEAMDIAGQRRTDDGVRLDEDDGWFLIRASGTEPIVRLTMEYKTKDRLEARKKELTMLIQKRL
jgi:phosphoglucosamine mutase